MNKSLLSAALALALVPAAHAAATIDTGTPTGGAVGGLVLDGSDWIAAKVTFDQTAVIRGVSGYILGGADGDTFDISLHADGPKPGWQLFTTTATFGEDGWNGASGLAWSVAAGTYWIEFEVTGNDTLGSSTFGGPVVLPTGVAHPLPTSATPDWGFSYDASAQSIGLQVSTVPWPASAGTMLAGLALLASAAVARRRS